MATKNNLAKNEHTQVTLAAYVEMIATKLLHCCTLKFLCSKIAHMGKWVKFCIGPIYYQ
jgi:hypothetical protein